MDWEVLRVDLQNIKGSNSSTNDNKLDTCITTGSI